MSMQPERPLDQIRLVGIAATGYHGVFAHERRDGQTFVADVVVHLDTRRAAASDDLAHTINYGELAERVAAVLSGEPADLIETVAERIAATVLAYGQAVAVDVEVHKPQAPIPVPFSDVTISLTRHQKLHTAIIALGANLGDPQATLAAAVQELGAETELLKVSPLAITKPVGGPPDQPPQHLRARGRPQVQAQAALVAVQVLEVGALARATRPLAAGQRLGQLDLDDVGAPVGQLAHRGRAGPHLGQVDHPEPLERTRRRFEGHAAIEPPTARRRRARDERSGRAALHGARPTSAPSRAEEAPPWARS